MLQELLDEQTPLDRGKFPKELLPASTKFPSITAFSNINLFVDLVTAEFGKIPTSIGRDNCTKDERRAIQELSKMTDIVIKPSDKGGNVVIWPTRMYEKEALRQLRDVQHYKKLTFNPLIKFRNELQNILDDALDTGVINKKEYDCLLPSDPKIATYYMLPKIHKDEKSPPGRPIISDSSDVLRKLNEIQMEKDMMIVTCDVESLYTSIKHKDGLEATRFYLNMSNIDPQLGG